MKNDGTSTYRLQGGVSPTGLPTSSRHPKFPKKIKPKEEEKSEKSEAHKGKEIIN
jgi:hypothetical protein